MLIEFFGNYPRIRVMDLLISNPYSEYSKKDIAEASNISRNTLYDFFEKLEEYNLIMPGRKFGQTQLYKVNAEAPAIKALNAFQLRLAEIEINKQMEIYEAEETADEGIDEDELDEIFNMVDEKIDEEIRELTLQLIKEKSKKKLLGDVETLRTKMKDVKSAPLIREDRNTR